MSLIRALATPAADARLQPFSYDPGPLGDEQVEIDVRYCGVCHSDLSMVKNEWGITQYPLVPGHEAIGVVSAMGPLAKAVRLGQTVGLGWNGGSCLHCRPCLSGDHNMCESLEQTIVHRHGAFGVKVRCHWVWRPTAGVVRFYNKRGTAEQWIKEGKQAVKMTRLSCHRFRSNEVRLWLSVMAYNLGNLWRRLVLPKRIKNWSLTSLQQRLEEMRKTAPMEPV
jgi:hypothetical protein